MNKISRIRVIVGGVVGGIVLSISNILKEIVIPEFGLEWTAAMARLGIDMNRLVEDEMVLVYFFIQSVSYSIFAVWLYAALQFRYGARMNTSIYAGLCVWFLGYLLPMLGYMILGIFSSHLVLLSAGLSLLQFILATIAGTALYKENSLYNFNRIKNYGI